MLPGIRPGAVFLLVPGVRLARLFNGAGTRPARLFFLSDANVMDIIHIAKYFEEKIKEKAKKFLNSKKIGQIRLFKAIFLLG